MLLESLKPLTLKSNVLFQNNGALVADTDVNIAVNPDRHTLIVRAFGGYSLRVGDKMFFAADSISTYPNELILRWDDYGDFVWQPSLVRFNLGCLGCWVIETYVTDRKWQ